MNQANSYPVQHQSYNMPQNHHANQPPKEKIIGSKDQAIQHLIYENTMLKKQLSQLMLKNTLSTPFHNINTIESAMTTVRPSISHMGSCRNSLQNSMEFSQNINDGKINNFVRNDNVCEDRTQNEQKIILQRQNKRAYRHSVDNLFSGYQGQVQQHINEPYHSKQWFGNNEIHERNGFRLVVNQRQAHIRPQQNIAKTLPYPTKQQQNCLTEQELYRQKMIKLKGRRNSQSKRLSEEKDVNKIVNHMNHVPIMNQMVTKINHVQDIKQVECSQKMQNPKCSNQYPQNISKLSNAHEILKSKINSPQHSFIQKNQINESLSQKNATNRPYPNQIPLVHEKNTTQQKKMIPKYTPKNFSQQKQNKTYPQQQITKISVLNSNFSEKTVERKTTEASSQQASTQHIKSPISAVNETKKVCLRELRGRVYLDDEGQGGRTKRATSKASNNVTSNKNSSTINQIENQNQNQVTKRNTHKQVKSQISKRINTAQSQVTYIDADSFRKLNITQKNFTSGEKVMTRKNSNKVYMEEDQVEKPNFKSYGKQKEPQKTNHVSKQLPKAHKLMEQDNCDELVSIEDIHMINTNKSYNNLTSNKQTVQNTKRATPPLSKQTPAGNQVSRNKNLYNQIYCEESKKDIHS